MSTDDSTPEPPLRAHTALRRSKKVDAPSYMSADSRGIHWPTDLRIYRRVYAGFPRQIDFARALGWTRGLVSLYETGARIPKLREARLMCDLLGQRMSRTVLITEVWSHEAVRQIEEAALKALAEGEAAP